MAFDDYGAPQFGLNDVKIAVWNATDDYGTAVDVPSVQLMGTLLRIVSARLEGDDSITATASRAIGGEVRIRFGSINLSALEVMIGNSPTSSIASPNEVMAFKVSGGDNLPYFGIIGRALAEEGVGDFHVFLPKIRITSDITLATLEYGNFAIPEFTADAVDDTTYGVLQLIEHEASTAIALPPANIA